MPRVKSGNLSVQAKEDDILVTNGKRKSEHDEAIGGEKEETGLKHVRIEKRKWKFMRKFLMPANTDVEGIGAESREGVLTCDCDAEASANLKTPKTVQASVA